MNKKIVFVNQCSGYLMLDIVNSFTKHYDDVVLLAGEINIRPTIPDKKVIIKKIKSYNRLSLISRSFSWLIAFFQVLFAIKTKYRDYHIFLVSNPPLTTFIPLFCQNDFSLLIYDIYPDSLVAHNHIKEKSHLHRYWSKTNKKVFTHAKQVFTISKDMQRVLSNYITTDKITVIYNWGHNTHLMPISKKKNPFAEKYGLIEKLTIVYSGNMGMTHNLETIIKVAQQLQEDNYFRFVFIGEGAKKNVLKDLVKQYRLENVLFLPFQTAEVLPFSMGAADIGLVTMDSSSASLSIPSKLYSYLAVGASILSIAKKESELASIVQQYNVGQNYSDQQIEEISSYLIYLKNNPNELSLMKKNARNLSSKYTPQNSELFVKTLLKYYE
ncbi:glycosyltransferase family 4 protein [Parabacteroides sp. OttesenSCG-928-G07]|nr:glycosyltransferase family 4 protein [Parabacteroides sp. OttesenSCG-928-G21]MDL2278073.1 glycosyltransferase family 4 protein [Parabacteroides sp. OttesenSCG-928-G07]